MNHKLAKRKPVGIAMATSYTTASKAFRSSSTVGLVQL
jgi:hypothetical protein